MFEFEDIIKSANIFICAKDKDLKYIYCNENVANSLGLDSPKQIIGQTDYDLFNTELAHTYRMGDVHVSKGGTLLNVKEIHPHLNSSIEILTNKNQLKNNAGDFSGVVVSFVNITGLTWTLHSDLLFDQKNNRYHIKIGNQTEYLTRREYDVLKNLLKGYTAKKIAKNLLLSPRTIEGYIENLKTKLQCSSKYHIIEAAMRLGIVQQNIHLSE